MSNQLISQFKRISTIKDRIEEDILQFARKQFKIAQEVHQEILGVSDPKLKHDYLEIEEYTGKIERWWSRRGEPDELVSYETIEIHTDIMNGRDEDYRQSLRTEYSDKKKKHDGIDRAAKIAHRQKLEAELARITKALEE